MDNVKLPRRTPFQLLSRVVALFATGWCFQASVGLAQEPSKQLVGTWKLVSWVTKFDEGDAIQPYGPNPKGRLVLTADAHWIIIITGANRHPGNTPDEKAALLDSLLAYSGKYTVEGDRITTKIDMSWNEIYTGANQVQTRFFTVDADKLIIRTGQIVSAVRPGQKAEGTLTFEREH